MINIITGQNNEFTVYNKEKIKLFIDIDYNDFTNEEKINNFENIVGVGNYYSNLIDKTINDSLVIKTEKNPDNYKMLFYKIYLNNIIIYDKFYVSKIIDLPYILTNSVLKIELYNNNKVFIKDYSFNINSIDCVFKINEINLVDNGSIIKINENIDLKLELTNKPYIFKVSDIINKKKDSLINLKATINNVDITLNKDTVISFINNGIAEVKKNIIFKVKETLSPIKKENSYCIIRINTIEKNIIINNKKYYNLSRITSNSKIVNINTPNTIFTTKYNKQPLFFYFIINKEIKSDFKLIDNNNNPVTYILEQKDNDLSFVYFNAEDNNQYFYKNNNYIIKVNYKTLLEPYYEKIVINNNYIEFKTPKYINNILINKKTDITIILENGVSLTYKNDNTDDIDYFYDFYLNNLTNKHISIKNKVKKIIFNESIDFIYNCFSNFLLEKNDIIVYKNYDDILYQAYKPNKNLNGNIEEIIKNIEINKNYAFENNELIEYDDGYISLNPITDSGFFYNDILNSKNEKISKYIYGIEFNSSVETEKKLFDAYIKNFKTSGMYVKKKGD